MDKTLESLPILLYYDYKYTMRNFKSSNVPELAHAPWVDQPSPGLPTKFPCQVNVASAGSRNSHQLPISDADCSQISVTFNRICFLVSTTLISPKVLQIVTEIHCAQRDKSKWKFVSYVCSALHFSNFRRKHRKFSNRKIVETRSKLFVHCLHDATQAVTRCCVSDHAFLQVCAISHVLLKNKAQVTAWKGRFVDDLYDFMTIRSFIPFQL